MPYRMTVTEVEAAAMDWLEHLGYTVLHAPQIAPGELAARRNDYGRVEVEGRLHQSLQRLKPRARPEALFPNLSSGELYVQAGEQLLEERQ